MNINKFFVAGRITADIELRNTPSGVAVANIPIAINRVYFDKKSNQKVEQVTWIRLSAFGKTAENIKRFFVKGQVIFAECRIDNRNWEKDGIKHYDFSFIVQSFEFGAKPQNSSGGGNYPAAGQPSGQSAPSDNFVEEPVADVPPLEPDGGSEISVEDIPF